MARGGDEASFKEAMFRSVLKFELLRTRHTLAVPEPDCGEDLWFARRKGDRTMVRAQLKSAFAIVARKGEMNQYLVNVSQRAFEESLNHGCVYFIGLNDDSERISFHIGCIPTQFLKKAWDAGELRTLRQSSRQVAPDVETRTGTADARVALDFLFRPSDRRFFFNAVKKNRRDVTQFFDLANIAEICSGKMLESPQDTQNSVCGNQPPAATSADGNGVR